jgi:glutamate 5-kinase
VRRPVSRDGVVVAKIGSSSLTTDGLRINDEAIGRIARQVSECWRAGHPTVLVTSAAVAAGLGELGLSARPTDVPSLQVAAAVGQGRLMERYSRAFSAEGMVAGQILLTKSVLADREQYLHARQALHRMLSVGVVPIVNENDTVAVEELRIGDNDRMAALVAHLVTAELLVLLTDTAGLLSADPRVASDATLLGEISHQDHLLDELAEARSGPLGSGGVGSKIAAARMAAWSGVPTVIGPSHMPDTLARALAGEDVGTWVEPRSERIPARKLWIAFGQPSEGSVSIDDGARVALLDYGRSLLAVGVRSVNGDFDAGSAVEILGPDGSLVGKGIARLAAVDLSRAVGGDGPEAGLVVVHRDDLVVLAP